MADKKHFVSVIIPNYNHARYLDQRIQSVLNQTYQNFEVIILDDKSTDNSLEVIDKYRSNEHITQIVINEENSGSTFKQWEKGIALAKGDLIWIAESDDYCEITMLDTLVHPFKNPKVVFSYALSIEVDDFGKKNEDWPVGTVNVVDGNKYICGTFPFGNFVRNASSALFSKIAVMAIEKQYMDFKGAGDTFFWILLSRLGEVAIVEKPLNYFRRHEGVVTDKRFRDGTNYIEEFRILEYIRKNIENWNEEIDSLTVAFKAFKIYCQDFSTDEIRYKVNNLWGTEKWINSEIKEENYKKIANILLKAKQMLYQSGFLKYRDKSVRPIYYMMLVNYWSSLLLFIKEVLVINFHVAKDDYKYACITTGHQRNVLKEIISPLIVKLGYTRIRIFGR